MKLIKFTILLLLALSWASLSKAQTSGGGTYTNHQTSYTYNGGTACYPYQVAASTSASSSSCTNGIFTLPIGSGSGGGGSGTVTTSSIYQMPYYNTNPSGNSVIGATNFYDINNTNVGIGSSNPGVALDVQGTIRGLGIALPGGAQGQVIMQNAVGIGTWSTISNSGGSSQWTTTNTNDVYLPSSGNVGIGTNLTSTSALTVMNGNVGIGTWIAGGQLDVEGTINPTVFYGNLKTPQQNVGIGTANPGQTLDVNGTIRSIGTSPHIFGSDNANSISNSASSSGDLTFNTNSLERMRIGNGGGVGIGTTKTTTAALTVMNGNVGIGTWVPAAPLDVSGNIHQNGGYNVPTTICESGTASTTTNSATEVNLANCEIPANAMGANGQIFITYLYKYVNINGTKTPIFRMTTSSGSTSGGILLRNVAATAGALGTLDFLHVWNTNATNAQITFPNGSSGLGGTSTVLTTGTIDTTANSWINLNCLVANSGDTCQVAAYTVEVYK